MSPEAREVVDAVAREILARSAVSRPPPMDLKAERLLAAAALTDAELPVVDAAAFGSRLLGTVYAMARLLRAERLKVSIEPILVALREQGWTGTIERELLNLRDEVPAVARVDLVEAAQTVSELAARRRVLRACETVGDRLRAGVVDAETACRELAEVTGAA